MPHSVSIQAPTSRVVRGSVSVIQAVSLSCCTSLKRQALPSWPKARQTLDALFSIQPMPGADRIVVQIEPLGDRLAAHPIVQQQQGIGPPRQSMSHRPISGQFNQVATRLRVKEATANHAMTRVAAELIRKRRIRVLKESGYRLTFATRRMHEK